MKNDIFIKYLLLVGGAARLVLFVVFYTHINIFPDSQGYIDLAERLSQFHLADYNGQRSPGYPLLISLAFGNLYVVVIYQFLLGLGTAVLWYKSLRQLDFSRQLSFYISLGLTVLLDVLFFETAILVETLTLFFMSLSVYFFIKGQTGLTGKKIDWALGLSLGMLTLIKPFYAFLPFLIFGLYLLKNWRWKQVLSHKLIIFIFPLIAYFGWSYVNKLNTGYFVSTTFFGLNIAQNCVRFAEKGPKEYNWLSQPYVHYREKAKQENRDLAMSIWYAYNAGAYDRYNLSFADLSHELGEYAKVTIAQNPKAYLHQVGISWIDFWQPVIHWNYAKFNFPYANKVFLLVWYIQKSILWVFRIGFLLLIPYYLRKAIITRRLSLPFMLMSIVVSASILQALVTYGTNSRFSFPFEFIMIVVVFLFLKNYRPLKNYLTR